LAALHRDGLLTEEEFAAAKTRVLAGRVAPVEPPTAEPESPIVPRATTAAPLETASASAAGPLQATRVSTSSYGAVGDVKSFWGRRSRGAKIGIVVAAVLLILAVIGGLTDTGEDSPSSQTSQASDGAADPTQDVSDSADLSVWASSMVGWSDDLGGAMNDISDAIGRGAYDELVLPLATLSGCSDSLPSAPTSSSAAQDIEADVAAACIHFEDAAQLLTDGIATVDASEINQAAAEMKLGNAQIIATTQKMQNLTP